MRLRTSVGTVTTSESLTVATPMHWNTAAAASNPPAVVYVHGAGDAAYSPTNPAGKAGQHAVLRLLVAAGYPVVSGDLGSVAGGFATPGGLNGWGNASVVSRIGSVRTYAQGAAVGARAGGVILVGISMGATGALNYAKANSANVIAAVGIIPVTDLDDIRINNRGGLRTSVDTAWEVTYPAALPAGANPATDIGALTSVPTRLYYGAADTTVIASTVTAVAAAVGATSVDLGAGAGHSETTVGLAAAGATGVALLAWLASLWS